MRLSSWPLVLAVACLAAPRVAYAADDDLAVASTKPPVVVWPTMTPAGDAPEAEALHRPAPAEKTLYERAQELDATLRDAAQDLGFTLFIADAGPTPGHTRDRDLIERSAAGASGVAHREGDAGTWVVSPRIESAGAGTFLVRIVAVPPRGRELRVRVETVPGDSVSVRGLVMLRDLLVPEVAAKAAIEQEQLDASKGTAVGVTAAPHSQGRAILAVNTGVYGAFTAFSLESATGGQSDPRVLYPLLALGTGIGVGAALLVADEWDVTTGDAWYLAAGGGWGAASGFLLAASQNVQPSSDGYSWALGGGFLGLGLATLAVSRSAMDDGDATLTHSGAALGLLAGGALDWMARGNTTATPYGGMGYGSAIGLVGAGLLATRVNVSPSRVLLVDLGAGGGALVGAAAASPLIFQNPNVFADPSQGGDSRRGWLAATLGGAVLGGGIAWWLTRDTSPAKHAWLPPGSPNAGIVGVSQTRTGEVPAYGVSWGGQF